MKNILTSLIILVLVASSGCGEVAPNESSSVSSSSSSTSISSSSSSISSANSIISTSSSEGSGNAGACPSIDPLPTVERPHLVVSGPGNYWQEATPTSNGGGTSVTVTSQENQTWHGFGATFNEAGWDALSVLPQEEQLRAIRLLFSASEGAKIDWGRIPMGASDYAMDRYTLNDNAGDYEMANFSIDRDREMLIPYIKAAKSVKPDIKFWGSPWTPPPWMKDNNGYNGGNMKTDAKTLQSYALYFARWVEEYEAECVPIDHVHPQNEPGYETRYPSCLWAGGLMGTFVGEHLGPTLEERGLDTDIWFGTLSNADTYQRQIQGLTGAAADYITGVGLQWNTINQTGKLANRGFLVMQTEHRCGNYPWQGGFNSTKAPNDHAYGEESWGLIKQWLQAGVNTYSAWNMILDTYGQNLDEQRPWPQNAMLVIDRKSKTLTATPYYYVFRHLSQFVDPGAIRMGTRGGDALAFRNPDGNYVVVVHNGGGAGATTVSVGGASYTFDVPRGGWATLNVTN